MIDPKRIERINDLVREIEGPYPYHADADEASALDAESAICRAAAEISGLLAWKVSDMVDQVILEEDRQALRRFAELAKEE